MKYHVNVTAPITAFYDCSFDIDIPKEADPIEYVNDLISNKNYEDLCNMELEDFNDELDGVTADDNEPLLLISVEEQV